MSPFVKCRKPTNGFLNFLEAIIFLCSIFHDGTPAAAITGGLPCSPLAFFLYITLWKVKMQKWENSDNRKIKGGWEHSNELHR